MILKKSSIFRCTVPGLDIFIENYNEKKKDKYFSSFDTGCDALRDLTHNWGHLNVWDKETLKRELINAGFSSAKVCQFGVGENIDLVKELCVQMDKKLNKEKNSSEISGRKR